MIEKLIPLLGKSLESEEIKTLLTDWRVPYPKSITCSADNPSVKGKIEKDCIRLHFGVGGNSKYLKPIPTRFKGGFVGIFTNFEFTKKRVGGMPFGVEFNMSEAELTKILGKPVKNNLVVDTMTWRKSYSDKHEFIVTDILNTDSSAMRSMNFTFIYEPNLILLEDYEKAGL